MRALVVAAALSLAIPASGPQDATDEATVRALVAAFDAAWNKGDAAALAKCFPEEEDYWVLTDPRGKVVGSPKALPRVLASFKGSTIRTTLTAFHHPNEDQVAADGDFEVTGLKRDDGSPMPPIKGKVELITTLWAPPGTPADRLLSQTVLSLSKAQRAALTRLLSLEYHAAK